MTPTLAIAALASLVGCLAHVLVGGYFVMRPLLASPDVPRTARFTLHFVWHMVTLTLIAMAAGFAYAAYEPDAGLLATMMTMLAAAFAFLNVGIIATRKLSPLYMPQWLIFAAIATLGFVGLMQAG